MSFLSQAEYIFKFKVVISGDMGVGKVSMVLTYTNDEFPLWLSRKTITEGRYKAVDVAGVTIKMQFWVTFGPSQFARGLIHRGHFTNSDCVLLMFDLTNRRSFTDLNLWLDNIKQHGPEHNLVMLVGNKVDMVDERVVSELEARQFAESAGLRYLETSSKNNTNIQELFTSVAEELVGRKKREPVPDYMVDLAKTRITHGEGLCFGAKTCSTI